MRLFNKKREQSPTYVETVPKNEQLEFIKEALNKGEYQFTSRNSICIYHHKVLPYTQYQGLDITVDKIEVSWK